jgi:hypothetical protein
MFSIACSIKKSVKSDKIYKGNIYRLHDFLVKILKQETQSIVLCQLAGSHCENVQLGLLFN